MLLADHFYAVNGFLAEQDPAPEPMSIDEMIDGLRVAGLQQYLGSKEWQRICTMIRDDIQDQANQKRKSRYTGQQLTLVAH